jgi:hypothetical protein
MQDSLEPNGHPSINAVPEARDSSPLPRAAMLVSATKKFKVSLSVGKKSITKFAGGVFSEATA